MKLAILDDDATHLQLMGQIMENPNEQWLESVEHQLFSSGSALLEQLKQSTFDVFILDRQVPDVSGDEILAWVRQNAPEDTIVVMLTNLSDPDEVVKMLTLGADDYVTKPFYAPELMARVKRLLKRNGLVDELKNNNHFNLFGFEFDRAQQTISRGDNVVLCSTREFALAEYLFEHVGQPLSRKRIFEAVWQRRMVDSSRALDTQIHRVRSKLGLLIENGFILQPIYGVGYRLDVVGDSLDHQ